MATFKVVVFDKRSDGFYSVFIRITQNRKKTHVKTDKVVNDKGVVKGTKEVKDSFRAGVMYGYYQQMGRKAKQG